MKTYLDCIPCFFNQIIRTGRLLNMDEAIMGMLREFASTMQEFPMDVPPPRSAVALYDMIARHAGMPDPFIHIKRSSTASALALLPGLEANLANSSDPVSTALRYAIAGNIIDFGISAHFDLETELEKVLDHAEYGIWLEDQLNQVLNHAHWLLYLGDNTGETVFDRLYIKTIGKPVIFVVRGGPIINDVTMEDALAAGLDNVCTRIVSSGCRAPGTIPEMCSDEFLHLFRTAPLIISKGQGNYETLSGIAKQFTNAPIFYLLKAKCNVVATHLGVQPGNFVLAQE